MIDDVYWSRRKQGARNVERRWGDVQRDRLCDDIWRRARIGGLHDEVVRAELRRCTEYAAVRAESEAGRQIARADAPGHRKAAANGRERTGIWEIDVRR